MTSMHPTRHPRITVNPAVMVGKPVIRGTRITVELVLRKLAAGMSERRIVEDHPHLSAEDIRAAAAYAADLVANEDIELSA